MSNSIWEKRFGKDWWNRGSPLTAPTLQPTEVRGPSDPFDHEGVEGGVQSTGLLVRGENNPERLIRKFKLDKFPIGMNPEVSNTMRNRFRFSTSGSNSSQAPDNFLIYTPKRDLDKFLGPALDCEDFFPSPPSPP